MSKKGFKKRLFASIFSFYFIVFQFFVVPSALAWPNFDLFGAGWEPVKKILDLMKEVGQGAMKTSVTTSLGFFLQTMAKDVAQGIVTGSTGQEPLFRVEDFTTSLKNAADNATGVFLDDLSERGFDTLGLCKPVDRVVLGSAEKDLTKWLAGVMEDLTSTLNLVPDFGEYDLTNKTPTCTVSKIIENMQDNIEYMFSSYFEYLFLDVFKKNCNIENIREFENNFSRVISSLFKITLSEMINPFSIIPSSEEFAGSLETLVQSTDYNFECKFFVDKEGKRVSNIEKADWEKTSEKLIGETLYPVIRESLIMAFGGEIDSNFSGTAQENIEFQITKRCYDMADAIDDSILSSIFNPSGNYTNSFIYVYAESMKLFNAIVEKMDPYYSHVSSDYLEHFKKCIYIEQDPKGTGPSFIKETNEIIEEKDCWLKIYNYGGAIEYNSSILNMDTTEGHKKSIKEALTAYCVEKSLDKMAFFPQIIRQEYNESLKKIEKTHEEKRTEAEKATEATTPNEEIQGTTDQISGDKTGTSTQTTQMVEGYQNSLQDLLTPTGDVFLDAGKLFLSTLLEGYFKELQKGIFNLPENFAYDDYNLENVWDNVSDQFDDVSDWFGDDDWGEVLLEDLVGAPKTDSTIYQPCLRNANCASGLCDFVGLDKVCVECIDDSDCVGSKTCSLETLLCE